MRTMGSAMRVRGRRARRRDRLALRAVARGRSSPSRAPARVRARVRTRRGSRRHPLRRARCEVHERNSPRPGGVWLRADRGCVLRAAGFRDRASCEVHQRAEVRGVAREHALICAARERKRPSSSSRQARAKRRSTASACCSSAASRYASASSVTFPVHSTRMASVAGLIGGIGAMAAPERARLGAAAIPRRGSPR